MQIVLTHHKSDLAPVNDLQRVVASVAALFISVLDAFLISDIFNRKFFEIKNKSFRENFWKQFRLKLGAQGEMIFIKSFFLFLNAATFRAISGPTHGVDIKIE